VYDSPAAFRLLITDHSCLIGFYTSSIRGLTSPVMRVRSGSPLYEAFSYYFERLWDHAEEPTV
jgi:hypothetical protein